MAGKVLTHRIVLHCRREPARRRPPVVTARTVVKYQSTLRRTKSALRRKDSKMLKGLDPLLGPDLLATLRAMGHGDEIALVDANFPAQANARRLLRADGIDAVVMVRAVLSVLPLDDFVTHAALRMAVVGA